MSEAKPSVLRTAFTESESAEVTRPRHYGGDENPHEPIKVIEHYGLGFCLGNALKYLLRAGRKPGSPCVRDLKKAHWYIDRAIERAEKGVQAP